MNRLLHTDRHARNKTLATLLRLGYTPIGIGSEAVVVTGPADSQVTKLYVWHSEQEALGAAQREFDTLQALAAPRSSGVATPLPISIRRSVTFGLVMERCPGMGFLAYLGSDMYDATKIDILAEQLIDFLSEYINLCGEPYRDFEPGNILYDVRTGRLTAVDFSTGLAPKVPLRAGECPFTASLAEFLSALVFSTLRPKTFLDAKLRRRSIAVHHALYRAYTNRFPSKFDASELARLSKRSLDLRLTAVGTARNLWLRTVLRATRRLWVATP